MPDTQKPTSSRSGVHAQGWTKSGMAISPADIRLPTALRIRVRAPRTGSATASDAHPEAGPGITRGDDGQFGRREPLDGEPEQTRRQLGLAEQVIVIAVELGEQVSHTDRIGELELRAIAVGVPLGNRDVHVIFADQESTALSHSTTERSPPLLASQKP